jgi:PKD repeat protein
MTSRSLLSRLALGAVLFAAACTSSDTNEPDFGNDPDSIAVTPLSIRAMRVQWQGSSAVTYRLERRTDLTGAFEPISGNQLPAATDGPMVYIDTDIDPDTWYGYRLQSVNINGTRSPYTAVRGGRTPPLPAVAVFTQSSGNFQDTDGFLAVLTGTGDNAGVPRSIAIGPTDMKLFQPLEPGTYSVTLRGIAPLCAVSPGDTTLQAAVSDTGLATIDSVNYVVVCRDPTRAIISATVAVAGGGSDPNGFRLQLDGIVGDSAVQLTQTVPGTGGDVTFDNLLPGSYQLTLSDVSANCSLAGSLTREIPLQALDDIKEAFPLSCTGGGTDTTGTGYRFRGVWSPISGGRTTYTLALDLSTYDDPAIPGPDDVLAISGITSYETSKLQFESSSNVTGSLLQNQGSNEVQPGLVAWQNFDTDAARATGQVGVIVLTFSVKPAAEGTVTPVTSFQSTDDAGSENGADLKPHIIIIDGTLTISGGGGGNQPTAEANGPYTGTVGVPVSFSSTGSTAAPGRTIVSYQWVFSDGETRTGASPTKAFAAAGNYTVTLTVTDDQGASSSDNATITISSGGGGSGYILSGAWSPVSGGEVSYTFTYDLTATDDPAIPGADDIFVISGTTTFDATKLDFLGSSNVTGSKLQNQGSNQIALGRINWQNFNTDVTRASGVVGIITFRFSVKAGATGTVTPLTTFGPLDDIQSTNGVDLKPNTTIQDGQLTLGGGGGGTPPTANANGPYSSTAGTATVLSSAGSVAAPGRTLVSYSWAFSDGDVKTGPSPSKSFAVAGDFTVTLTVTDDGGQSGTSQASITVTSGTPLTPFTWSSSFGAPGADSIVTLFVTLDLTSNIPATTGAEALGSFVLDALTWDPTRMSFRGYAVPAGNGYSVVQNSAAGQLSIPRGTIAPQNSLGTVTIIEVRFKLIGQAGQVVTTTTALTSLTGTAATGDYNYLPQTRIQEGTLTIP